MRDDEARILAGEPVSTQSENSVYDVPQEFKDWVEENEERIERAKSLPYFIRDNSKIINKISSLKLDIINNVSSTRLTDDPILSAKIEANRREYTRLVADPNYTDVEFNPKNGALKAMHKGHNIHNSDKEKRFFGSMKSIDLERECQALLYQWGHSAILRDEFVNLKLGQTPPSLDLEADGKIMDIRSITQYGHYGNAIIAKNSQLGNVKRKTGLISDCVCLHFHDSNMFSEEKLLNDIEWYKSKVIEYGTTKRINHIYVVINGATELKIYDI